MTDTETVEQAASPTRVESKPLIKQLMKQLMKPLVKNLSEQLGW